MEDFSSVYEVQVGPHSQEYSDTFNQGNLSSLSPQAGERNEPMRADWHGGHGEAGGFAELRAGGGILGFNSSRDDGMSLSLSFLPSLTLPKLVFIRTNADQFWSPSTPFLFSLRINGYAFFEPGPLDMPMADPPILSTTFSPTHPSIFSSDYCDAAEGMFDITEENPEHTGILAPCGISYHSKLGIQLSKNKQTLLGLGVLYDVRVQPAPYVF